MVGQFVETTSYFVNTIPRIRWYNSNPASCIGRMFAYVFPSLLWECHNPGGVINIHPSFQCTFFGFTMSPFSSNSSGRPQFPGCAAYTPKNLDTLPPYVKNVNPSYHHTNKKKLKNF